MKNAVVLFLLLLASCGRNVTAPPVPAPPVTVPDPAPVETFEERLWRVEGVSCGDITVAHSGIPPNCEAMVAAWERGRVRVISEIPEAANAKMSVFWLYRPELVYHPSKPYPLIYDFLNPDGTPHEYKRGNFSADIVPQITYSYEAVVEHEVVHALTWLYAGQRVRTDEAIAADQGGVYVPPGQPYYWYMITCHGTPDDPFGEPGNRLSCAEPWTPLSHR